jgi:hypothetical protein
MLAFGVGNRLNPTDLWIKAQSWGNRGYGDLPPTIMTTNPNGVASMPREFDEIVEVWKHSTLDGTPLGFGEMEVWGDLIPRVLRTLGCMTQARWAWLMESGSLIDLRSEQHFSE